MPRIYLSPPDVGAAERERLLDAFDSGWIAPLGEHVDRFEAELALRAGRQHGAALSSGTAALHLALRLVGLRPGDEVVTSTFTFVATANAVTYLGARPTFVDVDPATWQLDPALLDELLRSRARVGRLPGAVVAVDLYGQCADYDALTAVCDRYDVPLVEDAAEALGATYRGRPAGSFGVASAFSFNGNKIITTSGGGMLTTDDSDMAARARFLATQAREPAPHYEHRTVGYNYRMSNLLAAIGRAQLDGLDAKVRARQRVNAEYRSRLADLPGLTFMPQAEYGNPSCWLSCVRIDPTTAGATRDEVRDALDRADIEARPVWKPMHLQPMFTAAEVVGGTVSAQIFGDGLCLPSGSGLSFDDIQRIVGIVRDCWHAGRQ